MTSPEVTDRPWPDLPYAAWRQTAITLQLWMQMVGKVRLMLTPWLNHSWQVPLYVTARGLGSSPIPAGNDILEIAFDFISHRLIARTSRGDEGSFALEPQTVAIFYRHITDLLNSMGVAVAIHQLPNEMPDPSPSRAMTRMARMTPRQRIASGGRWSRPIAFSSSSAAVFWARPAPCIFSRGGFDLAVTRFSGRPAPLHPGGVPGLPDRVAREAYSHEVSSAGFWPGNEAFPHAAFYSYAYPEPAGFRDRPVAPGASFDATLGEFILPYDTVCAAARPDDLLLDFLSTTYAAAAGPGGWGGLRWSVPSASRHACGPFRA